MKTNATESALVLVFLTLAACAAPVPVDHPEAIGTSATMDVSMRCLQTRCDYFTHECEREIAPACTDCDADCVLGGGAAASCAEACGCTCHLDCNNAVSQSCYEAEYTFRLPNTRDETLAGACAEAKARDARCGEVSVDGDCDVIGRVEDPQRASIYECIAHTACGHPVQCDSPAPGTLGDEFCAAEHTQCESPTRLCADEFRTTLNNLQPWLRSTALDALRSCLAAPECQPLRACVGAWFRVTYDAR